MLEIRARKPAFSSAASLLHVLSTKPRGNEHRNTLLLTHSSLTETESS
jgi:hypothetical protein